MAVAYYEIIRTSSFLQAEGSSASERQRPSSVPISPVADLGFSPGGAPTPKSAIIFQFCPRKLHENERIWAPGGGARPWRPPLDPPMITFISQHDSMPLQLQFSRLVSHKSHFSFKKFVKALKKFLD